MGAIRRTPRPESQKVWRFSLRSIGLPMYPATSGRKWDVSRTPAVAATVLDLALAHDGPVWPNQPNCTPGGGSPETVEVDQLGGKPVTHPVAGPEVCSRPSPPGCHYELRIGGGNAAGGPHHGKRPI